MRFLQNYSIPSLRNVITDMGKNDHHKTDLDSSKLRNAQFDESMCCHHVAELVEVFVA